MRDFILYIYYLILEVFGKTQKPKDIPESVSRPVKKKTEPAWLRLARSEIGTKEIKGGKDNPLIVQYFDDVGHGWIDDDETAWCAAFVGSCLERSGFASSKQVNARSYLPWGKKVNAPRTGDIVIFWRESPTSWKGHVGFYVGEDGPHIDVLGGNQSNEVNITKYSKSRLLGYRRPVTGLSSRTNKWGAVGVAGAGSSAILLSLQEMLSISTEIKALGATFPSLAILGSCIAILAFMATIWARYTDLKEKGR